MLRSALHRLALNRPLGSALAPVVERFAGGSSVEAAIEVGAGLADQGYLLSMERATGMHGGLGAEVVRDLIAMSGALRDAGMADRSEIAVFPHSLEGISEAEVIELCREILADGVSVMIGMGAPDMVDATLELVRRLRDSGLGVGVTLQAALRRTERDCIDYADGPIRLVKGAYHVQGGAVFTSAIEVDKAYVRCARSLLKQSDALSFATHDPRLLEILIALIKRYERSAESVEFAFFLGRNERDQRELQATGHPVRIYIPFGPQWFERLVDGLAEQPGGLVSALRSLVP